MPTWQYGLLAFLVCGALAGLAGAVQVTAVYHRLIPSISSGYGYLGLMIGMLIIYRAIWVAPVALFFAALNIGSIQLPIVLKLDSTLSGVLQGALVLFVILVEGARQRYMRRARLRAADRRPGSGRRCATGRSDSGAKADGRRRHPHGLAGVLATAAPIVVATIGETFTERAGVINLSVNGTILLSAMGSFAVAVTTGSLRAGLPDRVRHRSRWWRWSWPSAASPCASRRWRSASCWPCSAATCPTSWATPSWAKRGRGCPSIAIPAPRGHPHPRAALFFSHDVMTYFSFVLIVVAWWWIFRTRPGLTLRAVGERPAAAFARGASVNLVRYVYTVLGGALVGLAGPMYSLSVKAGWKGTISGLDGLGWIVLAIVIFGAWNPVRAALGAYLFGLLQWLSVVLQPSLQGIPSQVLQVAPFPLMILTLLLVNIGNAEWVERVLASLPDESRACRGPHPARHTRGPAAESGSAFRAGLRRRRAGATVARREGSLVHWYNPRA